MNKADFIEELKKQTGFDEGKCTIINSIVEDTFFVGNANKEKMIEKFMEQLSMDGSEAEHLYETVIGILGNGLKENIRRIFFKKKD